VQTAQEALAQEEITTRSEQEGGSAQVKKAESPEQKLESTQVGSKENN
jgi:hypothetical protein